MSDHWGPIASIVANDRFEASSRRTAASPLTGKFGSGSWSEHWREVQAAAAVDGHAQGIQQVSVRAGSNHEGRQRAWRFGVRLRRPLTRRQLPAHDDLTSSTVPTPVRDTFACHAHQASVA